MAILSIYEFTERVVVTSSQCLHCRGLLQQVSVTRLDALKFVLGKKSLPKRYKCQDCGSETTKENSASV